MVMMRERGCETREDASRHNGGRATEWKSVVAAHHSGDWPPPEWLAVVDESPSVGVSGG